MDQRIELAMKAMNCGNFGQLCREHGISRKTGYKWRERFVARGLEGMAEDVVCRIVRLKQAHPAWGPRKIRELYRPQHTDALPSESSFKRVLERCGLTQRRVRRAARQSGRLATGRQAQQPNDVWSVDFKGWWHDGRGQRVEPLTVRDEYSRMILELRAVDNARSHSQRQRAALCQSQRSLGFESTVGLVAGLGD